MLVAKLHILWFHATYDVLLTACLFAANEVCIIVLSGTGSYFVTCEEPVTVHYFQYLAYFEVLSQF